MATKQQGRHAAEDQRYQYLVQVLKFQLPMCLITEFGPMKAVNIDNGAGDYFSASRNPEENRQLFKSLAFTCILDSESRKQGGAATHDPTLQ